MQNSQQDPVNEIASVLALRDGEPVDAAALPDVERRSMLLNELDALRSELNHLPDVPVAAELWEPVAEPQRAAWWLRYPLATAASVVFVSALSVFMLGNDVQITEDSPTLQVSGNLAPAVGQQRLVALMDRSRELEQHAYATPSWRDDAAENGLSVSPLGEFILVELARVDSAIEAMEDDSSPAARLLWEQRVKLLQAFIAEMEHRNPERFNDDWSM